MRWHICIPAAVSIAILAAAPASASVLLGYGETYRVGTASRTHLGVDVPAEVGGEAFSYSDGTVSFAGQIPADSGGRVWGVTVDPGDGTLVTIHPLDYVTVRRGEAVASGDVLGTISAGGDDSSSATHVHLSVRKSGTYVDPGFLLLPAAPETEPSEGSEAAPSAEAAPTERRLPESSAAAPPALASGSVWAAEVPRPLQEAEVQGGVTRTPKDVFEVPAHEAEYLERRREENPAPARLAPAREPAADARAGRAPSGNVVPAIPATVYAVVAIAGTLVMSARAMRLREEQA